MKHSGRFPALIAHGGAGGRAPESDQPRRRRALLKAAQAGGAILREGGDALSAAVEAVRILEDDPHFNAGFGSCLTKAGRVEMDAGVMVAPAMSGTKKSTPCRVHAGGVMLVSRVRNPILLARVVMEQTPHVLMSGDGAERIAREVGLPMCRAASMVSPRARERWLTTTRALSENAMADQHGTVGAAAVDSHGNLAAATSTGGVAGKLPGRIGDSAIPGAGLYAASQGAASATGIGETIIMIGLSRIAAEELPRRSPQAAADLAIARLFEATGGEAGVIMVDRAGRFGHAHNAAAMEIATFHPEDGIHHLFAPSYRKHR